ncbi:AAA family ATPase [Streptomyces sp. NBC_00237]|uniref:helix-turn-helix transcriptional regulator n=1 Tax=Streptomyces sp. NBC_00237 TaxID=2975687 RepID=UPI002256478D|nr:LuxR family transcriptional regulator [Streptomyces sp. NBC_00237]MCX5205518.1 AAA family ATPase [Streptomyces sp. NBC_00237]
MVVYGRFEEKSELDRALDGARAGKGAALVLWGDPGIGKTALLEYAAERADGFTVIGCRGSRMESGLAFAALHGLLWPLADRIDALPPPQAAALHAALGHSGDVTDRFLIGVATLTLLTELAAERPLLISVDDADWLDEPTAECLGFVARRLPADPVVLLLTGHTDPAACGPWEGLRPLALPPLTDTEAAEYLRSEVPDADEETVRRTVRVACGNPLALRELPTLTAESGERLPVGPRLRRAFGARTARLSPSARTLLLVAAAEDRGDPGLVREAATGLDAGASAWEEVTRSGLLAVQDGRVRFLAPLVGAVVYEEARFPERRSVHRALAQVLRAHGVENGLRAWHLAAAADDCDEEVAALLESSARTDRARGGFASAARALGRAAELSPAPADAARRLALAARAAWECGQLGKAGELLDRAARLVSEPEAAEASGGLRGIIEFAHGDQESAHQLLLRHSLAVSDPAQAVELACLAVRAGWAGGSPERQATALCRVAELTREAGTEGPGAAEAALLPALTQWWGDGRAGERVPAEETVARLGAVSWRLMPPAPLAVAWGVEPVLAEAFRRKAEELRGTDATSALVLAVPQTVMIDIMGGRWTEATADASETLKLAEEIGADHAASQCRNSLAWLAALRGDESETLRLTARTLEQSVPRGVRALSAAAYWHRAKAALFAGRPQDALDRLLPLAEPGHRAAHATFVLLAAADTVEAAVRAGRPEAGEAALRTLRSWADRTGAAWAIAAAHQSTALLAADRAEEEFRAALDVPGASDRPFTHARTRLLYGEWLRRARRRTDARVQLAEAADVFRRLGARPLLERALNEQELTGQQLRRDTVRDEAALTPQELRVARLAAEGLTNREIAAHLLISPRTVGHHLSNVFPKLGIVARGELARVDFDNGMRLIA